MKILCVFGEHAYGDPARGKGYEYINFLPALKRLGHEVFFFESFSRTTHESFLDLNRRLLEMVERVRPDVLFCVLMQYEVWLETLRLIRQSGTLLLNWSTDDSWKYPMFSRLIGKEFDLFVTTCVDAMEWYQRDGLHNVVLSQWGANAETLHAPLPAVACRYPVSFIGASYGSRAMMIEKLRQRGVFVECFGHGWPAGAIEVHRISEIVRESQVSLNFSEGSQGNKSSQLGRQIKARVFEVPGYGGCLLTEAAPHIERYFRINQEILVFEGVDDLVERITYLLSHRTDRDQMARRAFDRVAAEHTYDNRFAALLDVLEIKETHRVSQVIDWKQFYLASKQHRQGAVLGLLRKILITIMNVMFGKARGARAARRLVFELSWRLCGLKTYSSSGWPGRMFFRES